MRHVIGTKTGVERYQTLVDKACSYPSSAHVHVGGGRHVEVDPLVPGPGWTLHHDEPREHPTTKGLFAHIAVELSAPAALTAQERAEVEAANTAAVELGDDWKTN